MLRAVLDVVANDLNLASVRSSLLIDDFEILSKNAYQHIAELEAQAKALSYPILA